MINEGWVDIPEYEGRYQVSTHGRVKSFTAYKDGLIKKQEKIRGGYLAVKLVKEYKGKARTYTVHQLVAMAFFNHKPNGHTLVVDHIDNNRTNNKVWNLQVITHGQNLFKDRRTIGKRWRNRSLKELTK
jgi:hypothetical protein